MDSPRPPMPPVTRTILFVVMTVVLLDSLLLSRQVLLCRFLLHVPAGRRFECRVLRIAWIGGRHLFTRAAAQPGRPVRPPAAGVLRRVSEPRIRIRIDRCVEPEVPAGFLGGGPDGPGH